MFYLVPLHDADEAEQKIFGDLCINADSLKVVVLFVLSKINQSVCSSPPERSCRFCVVDSLRPVLQ